MTDYDTMLAGPDMDRLVAERLLGSAPAAPWSPSTLLADAMMAADIRKDDDFGFVIWRAGGKWNAAWMEEMGGYTTNPFIDVQVANAASADNLPLAICRALLKRTHA